MGFFDFLFKKPLGKIDPDDPSSFQTAYTEHAQARREGDAAVRAFFSRWGIKGEDHWSEIEARMYANGQAVAAMQHAMQAQVAQAYKNVGMAAPMQVEGMGVEVYAQLVAQLERAQDPNRRAAVLRGLGCDEARFARIDAGFKQLMSPTSPQGVTLAAQFQSHLAMNRQAS